MAWIQVEQSLPTHRKLRKLRRLLKSESAAHAVGYLVCLWLWVIDNAPDGDLSIIEAEDIADISGWNGDADEFVTALIDACFLDSDLKVHNWDIYSGQLIEKRERDRDRKRRSRGRHADVTTYTTLPTPPNPTENNTTPPAYGADIPTADEVTAEASKLGLSVDASAFLSECESRGWRDVNGQPIHSWRAYFKRWAEANGQKALDYTDDKPY